MLLLLHALPGVLRETYVLDHLCNTYIHCVPRKWYTKLMSSTIFDRFLSFFYVAHFAGTLQ